MSDYVEIECMGSPVTIEVTDDGDVTLHGWDEEVDLAAQALGMDASPCWIIAEALEEGEIKKRFREAVFAGEAELIEPLVVIGRAIYSTYFVDHCMGQWDLFKTMLHVAAEKGDLDVISALVGAGASINKGDVDGQSPLHRAVRESQVDAAELLISLGANIEEQDVRGVRPLHVAAAVGNVETVEVLLANGADVCAVDNIEKWTPYDQALHSLWTSGDKIRRRQVVDVLADAISDSRCGEK